MELCRKSGKIATTIVGIYMSFIEKTDEMVDLLHQILSDVPKSMRRNKTASQRIRTATIKFSKISKEWRKHSLDLEKKELEDGRKN